MILRGACILFEFLLILHTPCKCSQNLLEVLHHSKHTANLIKLFFLSTMALHLIHFTHISLLQMAFLFWFAGVVPFSPSFLLFSKHYVLIDDGILPFDNSLLLQRQVESVSMAFSFELPVCHSHHYLYSRCSSCCWHYDNLTFGVLTRV
jgi:hypothetical protein